MQPPAQPDPTPPPSAYYDDEIDLFELVAGLWQRKLLIVGITAGVTILALIYVLFVAKPSYLATAYLRPPVEASLVRINETGVLELTAQDAFERATFEARSRDTQRLVFEEYKDSLLDEWPDDASTEEVFVEDFLPLVSLSVSGMGKNDLITESTLGISFEHGDRDYAAEVANALVETAEMQALTTVKEELFSSLGTRIELLEKQLEQNESTLRKRDVDQIVRLSEEDELKRRQLQDQIEALRQKATQLRLDEIARLEEALTIAESLGIDEPTNLSVMARGSATERGSLAVTADISRDEDPDYLRGTRILSAELRALKERESDDHMAPQIREYEEQLALLETNRQIEILQARENYAAFLENADEVRAEIAELEGYLAQSYEDVRLIRVDQRAIPPRRAEKPKKALIVAAAMVAGGMLGVLVALVMNAAQSRRRAGETSP